MPNCSVSCCKKRSATSSFQKDGVTFHIFPKDPELRNVWKKFCNNKLTWDPKRTSVICSTHFQKSDFQVRENNRRRLVENAIPRLNPGCACVSHAIANEPSYNIVVANISATPNSLHIQSTVSIEKCAPMSSLTSETIRKRKMQNQIDNQKKKIKRLHAKALYLKKKIYRLEETFQCPEEKPLIDNEEEEEMIFETVIVEGKDPIQTQQIKSESVCKMSSGPVNIKFSCGLTASDPEEQPVLFIGQASHLAALTWNDVKCKLEPVVTEAVWSKAVSHTVSHPGESCEAYPRAVSVTSLPARRSRHAAPARPHAVAKAMRTVYRASDQFVVLVVRKRDVLPSCVALSRSLPLFSARTGLQPLAVSAPPKQNKTLYVEILLVPEDKKDGESEDEDQGPVDPYLLEPGLSDEDLRMISTVSAEVRRAAMLADMPTNMADVDRFIQEACEVAKELDIPEPTIIRGEELKEKGMGGIYGVGKAAVCPPALVVLSYTCPGACETVAWVGKGIVYDTGGLSIKARTSMVGMKGDCAGAAAVLGAFAVAVRAAPTFNLHAVLCMAENAVGPHSTRPDDIHTLYSGRTVEINNTDAEGRLVLSDGVVYAQRDLKANVIVDMATLTGAQGIATGQHHSAVVSNSGRLERRAVRAGRAAGEPAHPLPFAPELHFTEFTSAVADMKNSVADRNNAQPSCAGLFILAHLGFDFPGQWLHIDMAAPATCGERATGYGVALLAVLFGANTRSALLKALSPPKG